MDIYPMKLSIITINLNNKDGLRKTIESVVSQTFSDYEYIVIDGASTDESVEVIKEYKDKITYWISEPDKGIYNAMNKGILQAKGEYCLFLNSGDCMYQHTTLQDSFRDINTDIVYGNVVVTVDGKEEERGGISKSDITLFDIMFGVIFHQASFIRTNLFFEIGLYSENYKIVSDWRFFLQCTIKDNISFKYIDQSITRYELSGVSSTDGYLMMNEKEKVRLELIPKSIFSDYQMLNKYRGSRLINIYDKLLKNKSILKIYNLIFHGKL